MIYFIEVGHPSEGVNQLLFAHERLLLTNSERVHKKQPKQGFLSDIDIAPLLVCGNPIQAVSSVLAQVVAGHSPRSADSAARLATA